MNKSSFLIALIVFIGLVSLWEINWISNGYKSYHDDNDDLWAFWRRSTEKLSSEDVVIVGSSRAHFDIDTELWKRMTGKRPVMLASVGTSPGPIIEDIANNSNFTGLRGLLKIQSI